MSSKKYSANSRISTQEVKRKEECIKMTISCHDGSECRLHHLPHKTSFTNEKIIFFFLSFLCFTHGPPSQRLQPLTNMKTSSTIPPPSYRPGRFNHNIPTIAKIKNKSYLSVMCFCFKSIISFTLCFVLFFVNNARNVQITPQPKPKQFTFSFLSILHFHLSWIFCLHSTQSYFILFLACLCVQHHM